MINWIGKVRYHYIKEETEARSSLTTVISNSLDRSEDSYFESYNF